MGTSPSPEGPLPFLATHEAEVRHWLEGMDLTPRVWAHSAEEMVEVPPGSVDLIVTSPPYPMVERWDALFARVLGLPSFPRDPGDFDRAHGYLDRVWEDCRRVLRPGGILAVNIGDATRTVGGRFLCYPNHARVTEALRRGGLEPLVPLLWKKPTNKPNAFLGSGFLPPHAYVTLDCEYILLFRKPGRPLPPDPPFRRYVSQYSKAERDLWFSQVWEVRGAPQTRETAPFPEEIPHRLVRMFSCLGDTVLDPFAGSGTTLRVAREWGRRALGYELDLSLASQMDLPSGPPTVQEILDRIRAEYRCAPGPPPTPGAISAPRSRPPPR